ncbi:MarR family transcriptional regulator [Gordonia sp. CPCC 205515]|uniref:MarR family winged helix-turn-helix transcriptional regulator n=1 Tax=Gordonia sp. CPCC 205515 TaxID=3140791 RepID=UPI003AF3D13F
MRNGRGDDIERVHHGLSLFSRRVRGEAREVHPGMTYVDYSLLTIVRDRPGLSGAEVAEAACIDKSTASRQLAGLVERGMIERGEAAGRRRPLHITGDGSRALATADAAQRSQIGDRLRDWTPQEIEAFADLLERYNGSSE